MSSMRPDTQNPSECGRTHSNNNLGVRVATRVILNAFSQSRVKTGHHLIEFSQHFLGMCYVQYGA